MVDDCRDLAVGIYGSIAGLVLVTLRDVDRYDAVRDTQLLYEDLHLVAIGCRPGIEVLCPPHSKEPARLMSLGLFGRSS